MTGCARRHNPHKVSRQLARTLALPFGPRLEALQLLEGGSFCAGSAQAMPGLVLASVRFPSSSSTAPLQFRRAGAPERSQRLAIVPAVAWSQCCKASARV
jgi:hypothetical protein